MTTRDQQKIKLGYYLSAALVVAALVGGRDASAQERVTLQTKGGGRLVVSGFVEDYTGESLQIRGLPSQTLKSYPASEVVDVRRVPLESERRGRAALAAGDTEQATREFEAALREETRKWVRREVLALLVQTALRAGNSAAAGNRFLILVESDPKTPHFALAPLRWTADAPQPEARLEAGIWFNRGDDVARLLGASVLLFDPQAGGAARAALQQLIASADSRVACLAQAQQWRAELTEGPPSEMTLNRWRDKVESWPESLRAGPMYVLGRALSLRHNHEAAALAWLWLPLVDAHDARLAAQAGIDAGVALATIGQQPAARAIWSEVSTRFADTPAAAEARQLLDSEPTLQQLE